MRIAFIGTAAFAVPSLRGLVDAAHEVALVVSQPDRPAHRLRVTPPPVKVSAQELGLPVFQPDPIRDPESIRRIGAVRPELLVVAAYGQIIPPALLELPPRGALNVHASLLPRYRGAAPIAHAILNGDRVTGVSIMVLDEQLDHGPVLAAREVEIGERENADGLGRRLAEEGARLLVETISRLDDLRPVEQRHERATLAPKLRRQDGELSWELPAEEIDRRVRAFQPWPGVTLPFAGIRVKVLRGGVADGSGRPGALLDAGPDGVTVAAGKRAYRLEEVQVPGRRPVPPETLLTTDAG